MSYDLARLRRSGLIERIEHTKTYVSTGDGLRIAVFFTKVHNRLLSPLIAADRPLAPVELQTALRTIDRHVDSYIDHARPAKAA